MQEAKNWAHGDRNQQKNNTTVKEKNAKERKELKKKKGSSLASDSLCNRAKLKQMLRNRTLIAGG